MNTEFHNKTANLIEALPYIRHFYGKTIVIKCGGAALTETEHMQTMMQDIALLYYCGIRPVIIHGGGPDISEMCDKLQIPVEFNNGKRITDAATLEIVQMVLLGKTNRQLVNALNQQGLKAVGISGHDSGFLQAKKLSNEIDLGFVGNIAGVDTKLINTLLTENFIPVIAPIGVDAEGHAYNINADTAAAAIAGSLNAEKLIILSDVSGLYADLKDPSTHISSLTIATAKSWLQENKIAGGMIPKIEACVDAVEAGVTTAHILSGKLPHSLLLEIFTDHGIGTMIN